MNLWKTALAAAWIAALPFAAAAADPAASAPEPVEILPIAFSAEGVSGPGGDRLRAELAGVQFIALQHFGQLARRRKNDLALEAAGQRHCVQIGNRSDPVWRQGFRQLLFPLAQHPALLSLKATGDVLGIVESWYLHGIRH